MNNHTEYNGITNAFILLGTNDTQSVVSTVTKNLQTMINSRETVSVAGKLTDTVEHPKDYLHPVGGRYQMGDTLYTEIMANS